MNLLPSLLNEMLISLISIFLNVILSIFFCKDYKYSSYNYRYMDNLIYK